MPHGDFSDVAGILTLALGATYMFAPSLAFVKLGPLEATFDAAPTLELVAGLRAVGALLVGWGLVLFSLPVFIFDYLGRRHNVEFPDLFIRINTATRVALALLLLYGIIFFARRQASEFIYFAF